MRIFYHLSDYISHHQSGLDFADCLRSFGYSVTHDPADISGSDAAIIHDEPPAFQALFARHPVLEKMRTIAFSVWESEVLPQAYIKGFRLVREIWTPSRFSQSAMLPHFPRARILPHVVRRRTVSEADLDFVRSVLDRKTDAYCFFSIVDSSNPRKNVSALLAAFAAAQKMTARPLHLTLKQYRHAADFSAVPNVISLKGNCTTGQMAALHRIADAYVSAHHAEGWGMGMSEAMAFGKPVIATGWSGNMDFMDGHNSLPLPYTLEPVSKEMTERVPLFTKEMRWAVPDLMTLALTMKRVAEGRIPPDLPQRAATVTERFGPARIAERLRELLQSRQN